MLIVAGYCYTDYTYVADAEGVRADGKGVERHGWCMAGSDAEMAGGVG